MAQAIDSYITSRFHNLSNNALADAIGRADAVLKGADAECKSFKEEFKRRGLTTAEGEHFTVTRSEQFSHRLERRRREGVLGRGVAALRDHKHHHCHPHQSHASARGGVAISNPR
jgi:hypothetical protein